MPSFAVRLANSDLSGFSDPQAVLRLAELVDLSQAEPRPAFEARIHRLVGPRLAPTLLMLLDRLAGSRFAPHVWERVAADSVVRKVAAALLDG